MKTLTGLDATFLYLETPEMPMHVGSLNLCELPAGLKGGFHKAVQQHIASRMHLAPVFSRKLVFMPFGLGHPMWVETESVDVDFHIRRVPCSAKKPMSLAQAHTLVAGLHSELIDRAHPLWEFYVFDAIKLPTGKLVGGFFSKIHHAALDGQGAVMLANAMLDVGPVPRAMPPPDPARRGKTAADLKISEMIGSVFSNSLAQVSKLAKALPSVASTLGGLAKQSLQGSGGRPKMPIKLAPKSPFNTAVTQDRVFVAATVPLADCKAMGKAVGGSFNDVALWICSTALRSYLADHGGVPAKSMVAAMPVSLREAGASDAANPGNQVSMSLVELGTHIADPLDRMNAIMASTAKIKTSMQILKGLLPTDYPSLLAPWLVGGAAKAAFHAYGKSGLASRLPMLANLAISNVPGASAPLFLAGAKILSFHPLSIVLHGLALNITIQTYAGQVDFGIIAGKQALPDAQELASAIEEAFKQAQVLMGAPAAPAAPATPVKTPGQAVTQATALGKSPSVKRADGRKMVATRNKAEPPHVFNHDATRIPTVSEKTKSKAGSARRTSA